MARGAADRLDQRALRAQEAFLVGIEDRDQRHLRHVEALAQQVDADEHVELAEPQVADDLDALDRVDVGVQVAHPHAVLVEILGEVLGHALGQRRDQHALAALHAHLDLRQHVVDLRAHRPQLDLRVDEPGRAHELLDDLSGALQLVRPGRRRDEDHLRRELLPLVEAQRPVVERRRQAEAVLDQRLLARAIAAVHRADLRDRLVTLVDDQQ